MKETCTHVTQVARRTILGDGEAVAGWSLSAQKEPLQRWRRLGKDSSSVTAGMVVSIQNGVFQIVGHDPLGECNQINGL